MDEQPTIFDVKLSTRTRNLLARHGITLLIDLLAAPDADLFDLDGFGVGAMREVRALRKSLGAPEQVAPQEAAWEPLSRDARPVRRQRAAPVADRIDRLMEPHTALTKALIEAGASVAALADHFELSMYQVLEWMRRNDIPRGGRGGKGRTRPRWQRPHPLLPRPLDLRDARDRADWIANWQWDDRQLEQWETDGGPAAP